MRVGGPMCSGVLEQAGSDAMAALCRVHREQPDPGLAGGGSGDALHEANWAISQFGQIDVPGEFLRPARLEELFGQQSPAECVEHECLPGELVQRGQVARVGGSDCECRGFSCHSSNTRFVNSCATGFQPVTHEVVLYWRRRPVTNRSRKTANPGSLLRPL